VDRLYVILLYVYADLGIEADSLRFYFEGYVLRLEGIQIFDDLNELRNCLLFVTIALWILLGLVDYVSKLNTAVFEYAEEITAQITHNQVLGFPGVLDKRQVVYIRIVVDRALSCNQ